MKQSVEGFVIRLNFPSLTEERRLELTKHVSLKLEEAKVAVRNVREEFLKDLREQKVKGEITEDDFFVRQKELQKMVDDHNDKIKQLGADKEKEIMTI